MRRCVLIIRKPIELSTRVFLAALPSVGAVPSLLNSLEFTQAYSRSQAHWSGFASGQLFLWDVVRKRPALNLFSWLPRKVARRMPRHERVPHLERGAELPGKWLREWNKHRPHKSPDRRNAGEFWGGIGCAKWGEQSAFHIKEKRWPDQIVSDLDRLCQHDDGKCSQSIPILQTGDA